MVTLSESAKAFEPAKTKNIADLEVVDVSIQVEERHGKDTNGKPFNYKVALLDGEEYRVPESVLAGLKSILEKKPNLRKFSVSKQGTGMNTRYNVIPLE